MTDPSTTDPASDAVPGVGGRRARSETWLIGLNLVLLGVLGWVAFTPSTYADTRSDQPQRSPGHYTMVSGRIQGSSTDAIHLLDAAHREIAVLKWNANAKHLEPIGWRSLDEDTGPGGAPR